jgi:hypothetical protein
VFQTLDETTSQFLITNGNTSMRSSAVAAADSSAVAGFSTQKTPADSNKNIQTRTLKAANPSCFRSTAQVECLTGVALCMSRFTACNSFAFSAVVQLSPTTSMVSKFGEVPRKSTLVPRVMAQACSLRKIQVKDNVKTMTQDPLTGKWEAIDDVCSQAATERLACLVLEDLNNVREGLHPVPSELRLNDQISGAGVATGLQELANGHKFTSETCTGNAD